ncbi:MAG: hypothetical protein P0116_08675 [Candidatus Nitrosocosmicus sp.]|nr:hypothetical protein [Candidatus Nitrosocosmicus sp.]
MLSIGAVFATASILDQMTTAFARKLGEVQVGPPLVFTTKNTTLAGSDNATTAAAAVLRMWKA